MYKLKIITMRISLLTLTLAVVTILVNAQCVPNSLYQDSTYNIWPDTIQNLPYGIVDSNYLTTLQIKTPSTLIEASLGDTSLVMIDTLGTSFYIGGWPVDSFQIVNILGLPSGFSWSCSANNCMYNGDVVGCLDIFGNTTQSGTYPLTINVNTYTHGTFTIFNIPIIRKIRRCGLTNDIKIIMEQKIIL